MVTLPLLVTMLIAQAPSVAANAGRPSICVTASADTEPAAEVKNLPDSTKDLDRALRSLAVKHQFTVAAPEGACAIKLLVQRRIEDEAEETYTVVVRLSAARAGQPHTEELTATEGSWRGAASAIAGKVAVFVDGTRPASAGAASTSAVSAGTSSPTPPPPAPPPLGARTIEDGILDWVRLNDEGGRSMQTPIYMRLFTAEKVNLGTGGEGGKEERSAEAKTVQGQGPALLRETFLARAGGVGLKASEYDQAKAADVPAEAVIIEGEFVTIDPGSRAKRYFVGFGAGKSAIEIAGRVTTATGTTIAEFKQRRIGAMGIAGGDSLGKLLADTRSCGEDLAKFMAAWLANKPLK